MDESNSTNARLRRTFQYPGDDDDEAEPEAMDEQAEQETLIERLAADNAARNAQFRTVLLALPLLTTLPYIPALFRAAAALPSLLSLTSLLSTAFLVYRLPPDVTGVAPLDAWSRSRDRGGRSPLEAYLPYLNAGLALVLALMGFMTGATVDGFGGIGRGNLPGLVYLVVLVAKVVMASVDPERELSALKYEYKGA